MKAKLMALLKTKQEARTAKMVKIDTATDVAELRNLQSEIEAIDAEIRSIETMIAEIKDEPNERTAAVNGDIPGIVIAGANQSEARTSADKTEYRTAFLKTLLGEKLSEAETRAFTHTTANTAQVMPEDLQNKIYSTMEEAHPLLADVQILRTGAVISIVKHTAIVAGDAKVVAEGVANDDEENTFVNVTLSGKDFSKHVDFSYRLGAMSIPAFEQYLVKEISDRIGAAMAKDIVAQIKSDLAAANKFAAAVPGTLAKADVLKGFGLLKGTGKVFVYANNATFYGNIANMTGADGLLSFIPNYQDQIAGQLFGKGIKEEDALAAGEVLMLDPTQFIYNVVQDIMLERDKDIKKHVHTIAGFAIAEGTLTNDKAGALITVGVAG